MERVMGTLLDSANLFEVNFPEYKQLRACRRESLLLKLLWDFVYIVRTSIDDWKTTLWREINVEQMDIDCNRFSKDIKLLDKEVRSWNVYTGAESTVRNMMTSLKAVTELQNSAIRERHWQQLMKATGVLQNISKFFSLLCFLTFIYKHVISCLRLFFFSFSFHFRSLCIFRPTSKGFFLKS